MKRPLGRRRRRLRRATVVLLTVAAVALVAGVVVYQLTRPEVRRPGEDLDDITERLSRGLPAEAPEPSFVDVTVEAGLGDFRTFVGERTSQLPEDMGSGVAWGDFDNDGDDDLFVVGAGGSLDLPPEQWSASALYENLGDGTFRISDAFPETRIVGMGAAWGDADGDGWLDLAVTGYEALLFFHNEEGRLVADDRIPQRPGYWSGVAWADFDNDRDLDLYVCGYVGYKLDPDGRGVATEQYGSSVPYTLNPASFEPLSNLLFENLGDGSFNEVAALYGVSDPAGRSLSALWHDFDDDGRLDLYIANDISDNSLFLNRGDTFEDAGLAAWVADYRGAMGLTQGDWNRDGDDDLFVTHWVAQENALYDSRLVDFRAAAAEAGDGAKQAGPQQLAFSDMAVPLGLGQIALHSVGWGTQFADFDADGWLDLVVANGSTLEERDDKRLLKAQATMFLWNQYGEYFHDLAPLNEVFSTPRVGRGLAISDYDGDGDLDIVMIDLAGGVHLLRNDMRQGHWLQLRLRSAGADGRAGGGRGEGATVIATVGDLVLRRALTDASYLSHSSRDLHFGLGEAEVVERLEVRWLGGKPQVFENLTAGAVWELTEGEPEARRKADISQLSEARGHQQRSQDFWPVQRAAMEAMKIDKDVPRAVELLREALAIDPTHEDSRYYLANGLLTLGETEEAMAELNRLREMNPRSRRIQHQWALLTVETATSRADLDAAAEALEQALAINREETGSLLAIGGLEVLRGNDAAAEEYLELVGRTNPRAVGSPFLRGYLAWKDGDRTAAVELLEAATASRGEDWKPEGAVAEGDVGTKMHREESPLSSYWEQWDGTLDPDVAYTPLGTYLASRSDLR